MYVGQLLKYYSQFSLDFIWDALPMAEGYAYLAVATQLDGWSQFNGIKVEGKSYLEKAVDDLMIQAKKAWNLDAG